MKAKKIVVVDDDASILEAVQTVFQIEGYDVTTSMNGREAVTVISETQPHLVVLDILLSGEDGREIARLLKSNAHTAEIPIVLFSANPNTHESALASGANAFLAKPFDINELLSVAEKHMR